MSDMAMEAGTPGNAGSLSGGCACGAIRFTAHRPALRAGLCHCMTCRKSHAAAFNPFVVFPADAVEVSGHPISWSSSPGYDRRFCGTCGSRVIAINGDEVEVSLGSLDEPGLVEPQYESWIVHREPWLAALARPQNPRDRP